jgi:S1-C subfamily serine protease
MMAGVAISESTKRVTAAEKMIAKYRGVTFDQILIDTSYYAGVNAKKEIVKVRTVKPDSDADKVGIKPDDVIASVNGSAPSYDELLDLFFLDDPIVLVLVRKHLQLNATLLPL